MPGCFVCFDLFVFFVFWGGGGVNLAGAEHM